MAKKKVNVTAVVLKKGGKKSAPKKYREGGLLDKLKAKVNDVKLAIDEKRQPAREERYNRNQREYEEFSKSIPSDKPKSDSPLKDTKVDTGSSIVNNLSVPKPTATETKTSPTTSDTKAKTTPVVKTKPTTNVVKKVKPAVKKETATPDTKAKTTPVVKTKPTTNVVKKVKPKDKDATKPLTTAQKKEKAYREEIVDTKRSKTTKGNRDIYTIVSTRRNGDKLVSVTSVNKGSTTGEGHKTAYKVIPNRTQLTNKGEALLHVNKKGTALTSKNLKTGKIRVYKGKDLKFEKRPGDSLRVKFLSNSLTRYEKGKSPEKLKKGGKVSHPGFKAVQEKIAKEQGVSKKAAGAMLASSTRKASKKAVKANPALKKVKGK